VSARRAASSPSNVSGSSCRPADRTHTSEVITDLGAPVDLGRDRIRGPARALVTIVDSRPAGRPVALLTKLTSELTLTWRLSDVPDEDEAAAGLDEVLEALANPHRREIVYVLGLQPCAVSQLARMRGLSLPAIHKHIKVLENAGLVSRRKTGRTTYLILNPRRLRLLQDWVGQFHTYWGSDQASFENYQSYLGSDPPHR
jgi:DNA-binding transcriptional ArsR family regulator